MKEKNSKIIILYLYLETFIYLLTPIFDEKQISNLTYLSLIVLIIVTLYTSKFKFNYTFICIYLFLSIIMVLNLLLVSYKYFVIVEFFTFLIIAFIPLFIITSENINYEFLLEYWFSLSKVSAIIYPIYIFLYLKSYINYANIGYIAHINFIIQIYFLVTKKEVNFINIFLIIVNILMGATIGSRGTFAASIGVCIGILLILPNYKGIKYYITIIILGISSFFTLKNLKYILKAIYNVLIKYGIESRNLYLFIFQLEGGSSEVILAGRMEIYDVVLDYIKGRFGLPSGLGIVRHLTDDVYYYSHNIILDFILVLGIFGTLIFIIWYIYKTILLFINRNIEYHKFCLYIIIAISFFIKSIMGQYFINSKLFWIIISILIVGQKKSKIEKLSSDITI